MVDLPTILEIGTVLTVCKGIDHAENVIVTQDTKLVLQPDPTNPFDKNAIKIMAVADTAAREGKDSPWKKCGYLPASLAKQLGPIMSPGETAAGDTALVIECIPHGRPIGGLTHTHAMPTWFDILLRFSSRPHASPTDLERLKSFITLVNADEKHRL